MICDKYFLTLCVCARASFLSQLAMASLIRGNELELAVCAGLALEEVAGPTTHYALELLAMKYMTTPTW